MIDDAVIAEASRRLVGAASSRASVILFGSRARGEGSGDSDIDFLVIEDKLESKLEEMVRLRDALATIDVPVDIVVVSREEAERGRRRPGSVIKRALAEGRVVA